MTNEELIEKLNGMAKSIENIAMAYELAHQANLATVEFMVQAGYPADHPVMIANVEAIAKAK